MSVKSLSAPHIVCPYILHELLVRKGIVVVVVVTSRLILL